MTRVRYKYLSLALTAALVILFPAVQSMATSETLHAASLKLFEKQVSSANAAEWRFVFLGDNRGNDVKFKEALRRAAEFKPLFILHGGDIAEKGSAAELNHFLKTVREIPGLPPLFIVRGNHEVNTSLYEAIIGPRNYTLDSRRLGFRLVAVDNFDYALKEPELAYLSKMLDKRRPIQCVAMHIPPKTERWRRHSFAKGKNELVRLMTERKVKLGLFAHIHLHDTEEINGIPYIISGGAGAPLTWFGFSGEASYHIVVVTVKNGQLTYKPVRL